MKGTRALESCRLVPAGKLWAIFYSLYEPGSKFIFEQLPTKKFVLICENLERLHLNVLKIEFVANLAFYWSNSSPVFDIFEAAPNLIDLYLLNSTLSTLVCLKFLAFQNITDRKF